MATIHCTRKELEEGIVVKTGQRTRIVLRPLATRITLLGAVFDTNRAFILPHALTALREARAVIAGLKPKHILVVGHTETTGDAAQNDDLSLGRAKCAAAWLQEDAASWLSYYEQSTPTEMRWGAREDRAMLRHMEGFSSNDAGSGAASPNDDGGDALLRWFQRTRGLTEDGIAGPKTRERLVTEYFALAGVTPEDDEAGNDEAGNGEAGNGEAGNGEDEQNEFSVQTHGAGGNFPRQTLLPLRPKTSTVDTEEDAVVGDRRLDLFLFDPEGPGIQPAPSSPDGEEYLEWFKASTKTVVLNVLGAGRKLFTAELADALFRTNSAVVLPEAEAPSSDEHEAVSGVGVFATVMRFVDEHPGKSLLLAGHTDTTASVDFNQLLSQERADCALAILLGDRERFKELADARHTVGDYKQILSWCSAAHSDMFACDPGTIDDNESTGVEAVRKFQEQYNAAKTQLGSTEEDLSVDGDVGPLTWGAMFDVYQFSIKDELAEDDEEFAVLRDQLVFVDDERKALGFSEHHPVVHTGDGVSNQANRRVEFLLFDPGEEPDTVLAEQNPELSEIYQLGEYIKLPLDGEYDSVKRALSVMAVHSFFSRASFFPKPSCIPGIVALRKHLEENPELSAIVVGHADPGGDAAANLELSLSRAEAFTALVVGDEEFFAEAANAEWTLEEVQWLLHNVEAAGAPCYAGKADASLGMRTEAALGAFQTATAELPISYEDTENTRVALAKHYVQAAEPTPELDERIFSVGVGSTAPTDEDIKSQVHKDLDPDHAPYLRRVDVFFARHRVQEKAEELQNLPELYPQWLAAADLALEHEPHLTPIHLLGTDLAPMAEVSFTMKSIDGEGRSVSGTTDSHGYARVEAPPGMYTVEADGKVGEAEFGPDFDCGVNVYFEVVEDAVAQRAEEPAPEGEAA